MDNNETMTIRETLEAIINEEKDANKELETCQFPEDVSPWGTMSTMAEMARDALPVAEQTERMLNEAISLLTNSQYLINNLMAHSNLSGSPIGNEIRKLKHNIAEFLNSAQKE